MTSILMILRFKSFRVGVGSEPHHDQYRLVLLIFPETSEMTCLLARSTPGVPDGTCHGEITASVSLPTPTQEVLKRKIDNIELSAVDTIVANVVSLDVYRI